MKISASIYANKSKHYSQIVEELNDLTVDFFHVDCNDDKTVFGDIIELRKISKKPVDLHIISTQPKQYISLIEQHKPEYVCFQYEELTSDFVFPTIEGVNFGLAIKTETDLSVFEKYAKSCSFILFMATTPGQSGGQFDAENFRKVRDFKRLYPRHQIHVDGGVNNEVSFILRSYGVNVAVVGSFLVKSDSSGKAILQLKHEYSHSSYQVDDMMILSEHLPIVNEDTATVQNILEQNEYYSFGYTLISNKNKQLVGIVTNADIRRALLKNLPNIGNLSVSDLINKNAFSIQAGSTIAELFNYLRSKTATISYLPVVDNNKQIKGALHFNFLIKGEL